jgi:hypothetical protein
LLLATAVPRLAARGVAGWQPRTEFVRIASDVVKDAEQAAASRRRVSDRVAYVLYVYAEPGLLYHLGAQAEDGVATPAGNLEFVGPNAKPQVAPTFLVSGPHARRSQQFNDDFAAMADHFELVAVYSYSPSDLVLLNYAPPAEIESHRKQEIRLYLAK